MAKIQRTEEQGEIAFNLHKIVENNEQIRRKLLAENAKALYKIREEKLYKIIEGSEDTEWAGYLANISVYYSRNQAENLINIYKKFEIKYEIPLESLFDIPLTRLVDILPIEFTSRDEVIEFLSFARTNTPHDWLTTVRERKGLITSDSCTHKYKYYEICSICGERHSVDKHALEV